MIGLRVVFIGGLTLVVRDVFIMELPERERTEKGGIRRREEMGEGGGGERTKRTSKSPWLLLNLKEEDTVECASFYLTILPGRFLQRNWMLGFRL